MDKLIIESQFNWLEDRTIILGLTGSHAYGTNTPESDKDFKGICVPPKDYFVGLNSFNEYNNTGGKNFKNTKDDLDINIIHITKFVRDAMKGVPNNIELLCLRNKDYLKITSVGQKLIDNKNLFFSKNIVNKFAGYAHSQMKKLKEKSSNGSARKDLIEMYGYDTKFFMHCIRLLTSAIEILETCDYSTYRPNRQLLLDCRSGKFTFDQALEMIVSYEQDLKNAALSSTIPNEPSFNDINNLLIEIIEESLDY
ncbi:nucleotidyltransferase [Bacillus phage vB_BauM_KLEB27-3]|nr:nucleotidyltransferase [Bacillus phage vB_BauM_KLEB27-3]